MQGIVDRVFTIRVVFVIIGVLVGFSIIIPAFSKDPHASYALNISSAPNMANMANRAPKSASSPQPSAEISIKPSLVSQKNEEESGRVLRFAFNMADGRLLMYADAMVLLGTDDSHRGGLEFRQQLSDILSTAPFEALFWECVPVSAERAYSTPFEFVVLPSPQLAQIEVGEPESFAGNLESPCTAAASLGAAGGDGRSNEHNEVSAASAVQAASVAVFENLGGDAMLVVPCPLTSSSSSRVPAGDLEKGYPHLAAFVRRAPAPQVNSFWKAVGRVGARRLSIASSAAVGGAGSVSVGRGVRPVSDAEPFWLSTSGLGVYWLHVRFDSRPKYYNYSPFTIFSSGP